MPWNIISKNGSFLVVKKEGGKVVGTHSTMDAAKKQLAALHANVKENTLDFMAIVESKELKTEGDKKWVEMKGTALKVGESRNKVNYRISNLQENDGKMFNVLVGHRKDYDNPDHNVGEGSYNLQGESLKFIAKIKNTSHHPDIAEQVMDELVAPSIQGGYGNIKIVKENGKMSALVEGLHIPLLALVNKHTRGVEGATIESAVAERFELENNNLEVNNMAEGGVNEKDVFTKQIEEKDKALEDANKQIEDAAKKLKEVEEAKKKDEDKLKKMEDEEKKKKAKEHEDLVDKICEMNSELKKDDLKDKSDSELKIIEGYETKNKETTDSDGSGVVGQIRETANNLEQNKENILDLDKMKRYGDLTMSEEAYGKFNEDIRKDVLDEKD